MYKKDEIKQIRSIPTSKDENGFESHEEMEYYLKNTLPKEFNGEFLFKMSLNGDFPSLALIHYDGEVVASGIIKSVERNDYDEEYKYSLKFDVSSIKYFEKPISSHELLEKNLKLANGNYLKQLSNSKLRFDMGCFDDINELIISHYYDKYDFLDESFIIEEDYDAMEYLLRKYKNLILQGPPGVGKTFLAKRLADSIIGYRYSNRVEMVQFHQSYSYEDFIMGYKPAEKGFKLVNGPFYDFCKEAKKNPSKDYFFIIDEINRGDLSKIFGELFMLIEDDKRGEKYQIKLLYTDEPFSVPENIYIIGLMNTADRSIAMVDYALRRRFAFFDLKPGFDSLNFIKYKKKIKNNLFEGKEENPFYEVIGKIESLNKFIIGDDALNEGFCIGHSYFCNLEQSKTPKELLKDLKLIIDYKILPLLREYWFDEPKHEKIQEFEELSKKLKKVFEGG